MEQTPPGTEHAPNKALDEAPEGAPDGERLARNLDWNLLRTFIAIVQEGGITPAANRLLLKQPSVSNALKRLEGHLGRRLVDRGPGRFRITPAGELLYREALEIHGTVSRLAVGLRELHDEIQGRVTIALASHVVFPAFDETLTAFSERHPKASYSIDVSTSADVIRWVLEKRASFGLCLVHRQHPKLAYEWMFREHFGFFCGPRHRFFGRSDLQLSDLEGEPSVSFRTDALQDALRPVAILRAQVRMDDTIRGMSSNLEEVRRMITAGIGIGPLPIHVMARDVQAGLLWQLPPYDTPPAIDIYLVWNPLTRLNRAEAAFLEMLRERVAALPAEQRRFPAEG
ncbi:LysR family transcriptional regulator [Fodinicurvata fenggangensis]|uniref:LysR family transcriptional regulator n=1 Tax=Fodinicurvata fenggangensis TaxID=1121830 RepID=UPI0009DCC84E|nr:LysR family transcriptional regulator [Fodinicurvata fenggangensis]